MRSAIVVATLLLAACEMDFGFGLDLGCWGFCSGGYTGATVASSVRIGDYPALTDEVDVLVYAPSDTANPVAVGPASSSQICADGVYCVWLGTAPDTLACTYLARAERWDGARTELRPLFVSPPSPCRLEATRYEGVAFTFPAYAPLNEAFTVSGRVMVDGKWAAAGDATARIVQRASVTLFILPTDSTGRYTFATTDAGQRFQWCRWASVDVQVAGRHENSFLALVSPESCGNGREMWDVRFGSRLAGWGMVASAGNPVGYREARVELLKASDSTMVGDPAWTRDDGSYRLWFPYGTPETECGFLVRATKGSGPPQTRPLATANGLCIGAWNDFVMP